VGRARSGPKRSEHDAGNKRSAVDAGSARIDRGLRERAVFVDPVPGPRTYRALGRIDPLSYLMAVAEDRAVDRRPSGAGPARVAVPDRDPAMVPAGRATRAGASSFTTEECAREEGPRSSRWGGMMRHAAVSSRLRRDDGGQTRETRDDVPHGQHGLQQAAADARVGRGTETLRGFSRWQAPSREAHMHADATAGPGTGQAVEGVRWMPRRWEPRKDVARRRYAAGSCRASVDPRVSEWGNPPPVMRGHGGPNT
jgi:hypothetical protein